MEWAFCITETGSRKTTIHHRCEEINSQSNVLFAIIYNNHVVLIMLVTSPVTIILTLPDHLVCNGDQGYKIHIAILRAQTRSQEQDGIK